MRDVLFVQGAGEGTYANWDIHLVESLRRELGPGYNVVYPRMPDEVDPRMETWRPVIEQALASLSPGAVAVGHSVGGTILIHSLADAGAGPHPGVVVLIAAPFVGEGGWPSGEITAREDLGERLPAALPVFLFHGEDDTAVPVDHVEGYARSIPSAEVHRLAGRDHQLNDDLSDVAQAIRRAAPA